MTTVTTEDGKEKKETGTINKITDTELTITDEKGKEQKFVRIKDK